MTTWVGLSVYLLHMVLFVGNLRQVVSSTNKTVHQDINEILLEVVLNITTLTPYMVFLVKCLNTVIITCTYVLESFSFDFQSVCFWRIGSFNRCNKQIFSFCFKFVKTNSQISNMATSIASICDLPGLWQTAYII